MQSRFAGICTYNNVPIRIIKRCNDVFVSHDDIRLLYRKQGDNCNLEYYPASLRINRKLVCTGITPVRDLPNHLASCVNKCTTDNIALYIGGTIIDNVAVAVYADDHSIYFNHECGHELCDDMVVTTPVMLFTVFGEYTRRFVIDEFILYLHSQKYRACQREAIHNMVYNMRHTEALLAELTTYVDLECQRLHSE